MGDNVKVVQINATCGAGSTGKICLSISQLLNDLNVENYILYSLGTSNDSQGIKYQSDRYTKRMALRSRILGNYGFNSKRATLKLLEELLFLCQIQGKHCSVLQQGYRRL